MVKERQTVQLAKQFQMLNTLDDLYKKSKEGEVFTSLIPVIASRNNILQAIAKLKASKKGKDDKKNIILIKEEVHRLIHSTQLETQMGILRAMTTEERLAIVGAEEKLNKFRKEVGNEPISVINIIKQLKLKSK